MKKARPTVRPKGRAPTGADLEDIRRLIERAGGEHEFQGWIKKALGKRGRGRPPGATRYDQNDYAALLVTKILLADSEGKRSRHTVLRDVVEFGVREGLVPEGSKAATIKRLAAKLA